MRDAENPVVKVNACAMFSLVRKVFIPETTHEGGENLHFKEISFIKPIRFTTDCCAFCAGGCRDNSNVNMDTTRHRQ